MSKRYKVAYFDNGIRKDAVGSEENVKSLINMETNDNNRFMIVDIKTDGQRNMDFFNPVFVSANDYCDKLHGYIIKDSRSEYKALAPATDKVMVFDDIDAGQRYYNRRFNDILIDYMNQKDVIDVTEDNVIYDSKLHKPLNNTKLDLDFKNGISMFPSDEIYAKDDIRRILSIVDAYDKFYSSEDTYLHPFKRGEVAGFMLSTLKENSNDSVTIQFDKLDKHFKPSMNMFAASYPEAVRDSINKLEDYYDKLDTINNNSVDLSYEQNNDLEL